MSGVAGRRRRFWCLPVRSVYDAPGSTIFVSLPSQPQARLGLPLSLSVSDTMNKTSHTCSPGLGSNACLLRSRVWGFDE